MVFFNYTTMQASAKIVYYGPGLCGKTTNLQYIHAKTDPASRGEMVSLETEADRTLFFDLLPLEVGTIGGMRVRIQLYTVPGQVFYNTTRKLVLKGVDGVVFVADSQVPALDANLESLENLRRNLEELNQPFEKIAFVLQYNKRDLRNILSTEVLNRNLNREGHGVFEAAALHGVGVFETLKAISKKTLAAVHRRISGEDLRRDRVAVSGPVPSSRGSTPADTAPRTWMPSRAPLTPPATAERVKPGTDEVKVEFAASQAPGGASGATPTPERRVPTKSRLDIERELEELRYLAWGSKGASALPSTTSKPADLLTGGSALERQVKLRIPQATLENATHLTLDVSVGGASSDYKVTDSLQVDLPPRRPGNKPRLRVTLEIEGEEN